jgi:hypothetical protein
MKLATFNVDGINGRLPVLLRWLDEAAPDIVCLQELKASQEKFPEAPPRDAGFGVIWQGQKSWNGVAPLARGKDPVETRRGLPGDRDDRRDGVEKLPGVGGEPLELAQLKVEFRAGRRIAIGQIEATHQQTINSGGLNVAAVGVDLIRRTADDDPRWW